MARRTISEDTRMQVNEIIDRFNQEVVKNPDSFFVPRYHGKFLYLDRRKGNSIRQRGRLKYTGNMAHWEFAIFKYSSDSYDPDEWFFSGAQHVNGTIEGALKACMEAYPQSERISLFRLFFRKRNSR